MLNRINIRYGKLVVRSLVERDEKGRYLWACICDCGNATIAVGNYLGNRKNSCGCLIGKKITHGKRNTKTYKSWSEMKQRTTNPNNDKWKYYGGRGIKVCDRWLNSFEDFLADMGDKPDGMTVDRIDSNGNYEPGNCQWADRIQQSRNRRNVIHIEYNGSRFCLSVWAKIKGVKSATLWDRYKRGLVPPELFFPVGDLPRGGRAHKANNRMIDGSHR